MPKTATIKKQEATPVSLAHQKTLHKWHAGFGLLLVVQAGLVVAFGTKISVPITTRYIAVDQLASQAEGHQVLATATRHLFDVRFSWVIAAFLLLFAIVHLIAASSYESKYIENLQRGVSRVRWVAFGLGGGALIAAVALLGGLNDIATIALLWGLVVISSLCALAVESLGPGRTGMHRLLGFVSGISFALPWLVLVKTIIAAAIYGGSVSGRMWGVYGALGLFSVAVVTATLFRWGLRGRWTNIVYAEKMYMLLGLVTASLLAWQMFVGVR